MNSSHLRPQQDAIISSLTPSFLEGKPNVEYCTRHAVITGTRETTQNTMTSISLDTGRSPGDDQQPPLLGKGNSKLVEKGIWIMTTER